MKKKKESMASMGEYEWAKIGGRMEKSYLNGIGLYYKTYS